MATLKQVGSTSNTISFSVTEINTSHDSRTLYIYQDGVNIDGYDLINGRSSFEFTVYDLEPSTSYTFYVSVKGYVQGLGEMTIDWSDDVTASTSSSGGGSSGGDETTEWDLSTKTYSDISSDISYSHNFDEYEVLRLKLTFVNNGTAYFSTNGADDSVIFIGTSSSFDSEVGEPSRYDDYDTNRRGDTSLEYNVTVGKTYYLYVRHLYEDSYGRFTIEITPPSGNSSGRPAMFSWDTPKVKGAIFDLTASEWCRLLDNINAVREYMGYSIMPTGTGVATFTYPSKGNNFTALMYNQCIYAMSEKDNVRWINYDDHSVQKGDPITAAKLNFLMDTINSIG